jgi:hypothetical protein
LQQNKAIALTFRPFLATFFIFEKEARNGKKISEKKMEIF